MDSKEFREFGKAAVDYIADYYDNIRDRPVLSAVEPGYLKELIPDEAPKNGEDWKNILKDVEDIIMPGMTHWHSPNFHAYYLTGNSFPSMVGEILSAGLGCIGLSWIASPACTELEVVMMNWLGKLLNLPEEFLNCSEGPGGGVIQGSASEVTLVALLAAKEKKVKDLMQANPNLTEAEIKGKLIAYSSDQSNSSVEKSGLLGSMPMKLLPADEFGVLRGKTLQEAIEKDKKEGLIPCYVVACLGTTPTCAFDDLEEIGPICQKEKLWLHVDAAYAGAAFACPEYRYLMKGVDYADSFNVNVHKWMLVNFDCSAMWVKNAKYLVEAFNVERIYLEDQHKGLTPEYRHWQIALGRRFRALKVWFVLRSYGIEGIQKHIRHHVALANHFKFLVENDQRFEVCTASMGLVCFRLKGEDEVTKALIDKISESKKLFIVPGHFNHKLVVRFAVCGWFTEKSDIDFAWKEILKLTEELCTNNNTLATIFENMAHKKMASLNINTTRCELRCTEKSK